MAATATGHHTSEVRKTLKRSNFMGSLHLPQKAKEVLDWFADHTQPLKRMVYLIDEEPESFRLRLTYLRLHGLRDFAA